MEDTGIEMKQLTNWFVNNRKRYWKPRVEARLQQQAQAAAAAVQAHAAAVAAVNAATVAGVSSNQPALQPSSPVGLSITSLVSPDTPFKPSIMASPTLPPAPSSSTSSSASPYYESQATPSLTAQLLAAHHQQQQQQVLLAPVTTTTAATTTSAVAAGTLPSSVSTNSLTSDEDTEHAQLMLAQSHQDQQQQQQHCPDVDPMTTSARNVSFSSLEQVSGEVTSQSGGSSSSSSSSAASSDVAATARTTATVAAAAAPIPSRKAGTVPFPNLAALSQKKKRKHAMTKKGAMSESYSYSSSSEDVVAPRKRFRRVSMDLWIESCQKAAHINDEALPSLEEASRLFGYSSN